MKDGLSIQFNLLFGNKFCKSSSYSFDNSLNPIELLPVLKLKSSEVQILYFNGVST